MGLLDFAKYLFNDIPIDYQGPETGWYVVPNYSQFTYSSVRGDFRLLPLAEGRFAACWKDFVQVRDAAGLPLWRANDTGHTATVSPDGRQLLAFGSDDYQLTRFDSRTGQVLAQGVLPPLPPDPTGQAEDADELYQRWPEQLIWLPDQRVLVLLRSSLGVLAPDGRSWQAHFWHPLPANEYGPATLSNMVWQPQRPTEVLVADYEGRLAVLHLGTRQVLRQTKLDYATLLPGPLGQQPLLLDQQGHLLLLDVATLGVVRRFEFEGLEGVRTEAENQHQNSATLWEKQAVFSPSGKYLLAVDKSGLVWLLDGQSGYKLRLFRRKLLNHAYDVMWLNDKQFLALTNRGHVVRQNIEQLENTFDVTDFTADDDARHLPSTGAAESMRTASTEADVVAALATLGTTPDAAAYAQAWHVIHYAPAEFDWHTHLTPAGLAGVMRQVAWMLPSSGFAPGLGLFAEMRQALLAVQYHLPSAPVAPVLALHDSVFGPQVTFETLEAEFEVQEIECQLQQAYNGLKWALLDPEAEDVETGEPFLLSEHHARYERLCDEVEAFIEHFTSGYGWEAHNVLERAFPQLASYYAQRLATFPAPVQRRLLRPVRWHDDPSAVALLHQLAATSPHQDIRAFAKQALAESGS